ncbi:unnamed protein product [Pylaiella littoralis]
MENARRTVRPILGLAVTTLVALSSCLHNVLVGADDILKVQVSESFGFTGGQMTILKEEVLPTIFNFTSYTTEEGIWITRSESSGKPVDQTVWTSGMVAGIFMLQYEATMDEKFLEFADETIEGLAGLQFLDDNDLGFQILNSYGQRYRLAGGESYKEACMDGADTLFTNRYLEFIKAYWTWKNPSRRKEWDLTMNVDMIMNMEIMAWASLNGGGDGGNYMETAIEHADTTWDTLVRPDYSTNHVVAFDPDTGEVIETGTYQGWRDNSTWSRGQAWAIYGHVMMNRYSPEERFLERFALLLQYFVDNNREDNIPFSDFDAPEEDLNAADDDNVFNPRDSSATAIVASALFEAFQQTGVPYYLELAQLYLGSLLGNKDYFDPDATDSYQAIFRAASAEHGDPETGSMTGEYFGMEGMASLTRYKNLAPAILLRNEDSVSITDSELTAAFTGESLDNDVDISDLKPDAAVRIWLGVTLSNTGFIPSSVSINGVAQKLEEPAGGWTAGNNSAITTAPASTFGVTTVDSVTVTFVSSSSSSSSGAGVTKATVGHLIVGHKFDTMIEAVTGYGTSDDEVTEPVSYDFDDDTTSTTTSATSTPVTVTSTDDPPPSESGDHASWTWNDNSISYDFDEDASDDDPCRGIGIYGGDGVCCHPDCKQCGGSGCPHGMEGLTDADCCQNMIVAYGQFCGGSVVGPCVLP